MISIELEEIHILQGNSGFSSCQCEVFIDTFFRSKTENDRVQSFIFFGLNITGPEETVLLNVNAFLHFRYGNNRISNLLRPNVHHLANVLPACITKSSPKVSSCRIPVGMLFQITSYALNENIFTNILG